MLIKVFPKYLTCRCSFEDGKVFLFQEVLAFFFLLVAPRFPVSPPPVYVLKGSTAVLECRPESNPPAVISWMRNGQNLPGNGNLYSVSNVQPADEGMYKCKARNNRGTAEGDVQLAIGSKLYCL